VPALDDSEIELARPHGADDALGEQPCAIGDVHPLTGGDPAHRAGVPALGSGQRELVAAKQRLVTDEDWRSQRALLAFSGR
jgi:hypothetical protein